MKTGAIHKTLNADLDTPAETWITVCGWRFAGAGKFRFLKGTGSGPSASADLEHEARCDKCFG